MAELCIPCEQFVNSGENERKNTEISGQAGKISPRGAKKDASAAIGNTVTLFMSLSVVLLFVLLVLRGSIVSVMSTPEEAVSGTLDYLTICFIGIPFITAYNIIASIFRGLGDSKSPMYFIAVACVVNIALDYYFMCTLHLGPACASANTTPSRPRSTVA